MLFKKPTYQNLLDLKYLKVRDLLRQKESAIGRMGDEVISNHIYTDKILSSCLLTYNHYRYPKKETELLQKRFKAAKKLGRVKEFLKDLNDLNGYYLDWIRKAGLARHFYVEMKYATSATESDKYAKLFNDCIEKLSEEQLDKITPEDLQYRQEDEPLKPVFSNINYMTRNSIVLGTVDKII